MALVLMKRTESHRPAKLLGESAAAHGELQRIHCARLHTFAHRRISDSCGRASRPLVRSSARIFSHSMHTSSLSHAVPSNARDRATATRGGARSARGRQSLAACASSRVHGRRRGSQLPGTKRANVLGQALHDGGTARTLDQSRK
jgi:hypothetical protein